MPASPYLIESGAFGPKRTLGAAASLGPAVAPIFAFSAVAALVDTERCCGTRSLSESTRGTKVDKLDWRFDKDVIIVSGIVYALVGALLTIVVGYLFHVGWALYGG